MPIRAIAAARGADAFAVAVVVAVISGAMVAVQTRINGVLAEHIGHFPAAGVSFATGLTLLSTLLVLQPFRRHLAAVPASIRGHRLRWWQVLGGVGGGLIIATQTYAVPLIGVSAFLIAIIGGQGTGALLVDRAGLGPAAAMPLSFMRVAATVAGVGGVAVAATAGGSSDGAAFGGIVLPVLPLVLAFAVGLGGAVQYAFNALVTTVTHDPMATTWINFAIGGTTVAIIASGVALGSSLSAPTSWTAPWWAWVGGPCGVVVIAGAAWAVQHTGVLVYGLIAVTSQISAGVALDLSNPGAPTSINALFMLGVAMTLSGAALAGLAASRTRRDARLGS